MTSPPAILNNLAIVGALVADSVKIDQPGGVVRAYDVRSGELAWYWDPVPPGREPRTDPANDIRYERGTPNVWSIISVDSERDLVFLPTGNANNDYFATGRERIDHYSSSVVALHGDTGEVAWHFQMVHNDVWDYDTPSQPTLYDVEVDGEIVPALTHTTKMGHVFLLNRATGEPLFPVEERPVPQSNVPFEVLSPTQPFPTKPPPLHNREMTVDSVWGLRTQYRRQCQEKIAGIRAEGIFTPPSLEGSVFYPGPGGGINWGSPAIDPVSKTIVVKMNYFPMISTLTERRLCEKDGLASMPSTPYCHTIEGLTANNGMPCDRPPYGELIAIDYERGEINWRVPAGTMEDAFPLGSFLEGSPGAGGPMVTASGLIFMAATGDHYLKAYDIETGDLLWRGRLPAGGHAIPMSYRLDKDGRQYVVIAAGGHWSMAAFDQPLGAWVVAFALPDP